MPNILLDPNRWTDEFSYTPPSYWTGVKYEFLDSGGGIGPKITATATASDVVAFVLDILTPSSSPGSDYATFSINGTVVFTQDTTVVGSYPYASSALSAGDTVAFNMSSSGGSPMYSIDATLTPPAGCFWTDFVGVTCG